MPGRKLSRSFEMYYYQGPSLCLMQKRLKGPKNKLVQATVEDENTREKVAIAAEIYSQPTQ
jgi:hypothetical protein